MKLAFGFTTENVFYGKASKYSMDQRYLTNRTFEGRLSDHPDISYVRSTKKNKAKACCKILHLSRANSSSRAQKEAGMLLLKEHL